MRRGERPPMSLVYHYFFRDAIGISAVFLGASQDEKICGEEFIGGNNRKDINLMNSLIWHLLEN